MSDRTIDHEALAARFYAQQILFELVGKSVQFKTEVQREDFTVARGATGVVLAPFMDDGLLVAAVQLDNPPEGAEPFDDEVHWKEDVNLFDFEDEIALT